MFGLDGRTAIVTGGGGNIGSATVRALRGLGAKVLVVDHDGERAAGVASGVDGAVGWRADVTRADEVDANVASPAGLRAAPGMAAYGASKAALINFTWTLAVELGPHGIRCNVVVPAFVPNPDVSWGGSPEEQDALARRVVPMGRVTRAEDVAGAIVAFASGLMSFSTGQVVVCDGGRMLTNPLNPGSSG